VVVGSIPTVSMFFTVFGAFRLFFCFPNHAFP
jgi:hypothetical protein